MTFPLGTCTSTTSRNSPMRTSTSACTASSAASSARRWTSPTCRRRSACTHDGKFLRKPRRAAGLDPEPFIEREKHTTIKPLWDLWRSVTQDFFGTASFGIAASETYARGVRHFLEDELGCPAAFAFRAPPGHKTDNEACAPRSHDKAPLIVFGSYNERMYLAEIGGVGLHPGVAARHHHPPPHGHAVHGLRRCLLPAAGGLQRAVRCAVQHPAPGHDLDRSRRRRRGSTRRCPGALRPRRALEARIAREPVLVRISAAKRLRDAAERGRASGPRTVTLAHLGAVSKAEA
jgi:chlorophyllide a reductase subunit Z